MSPHVPDRVAIYVAGDSNIFFPALVAIESIQRHNRHLPLDYYLFFEEEGLTGEMQAELHKAGIRYVASSELAKHGDTSDLAPMVDSRWPEHVFHNWIAPNYLASLGYKHVVKADFDLLCVAPYDLADLVSDSHLFSAVTFPVDLVHQGVNEGMARNLGFEDLAPLKRSPYFNVGFVGINAERYFKEGLLAKFKQAYKELESANPPVPNAEQAATALIALAADNGVRHIDPNYNVRATTVPSVLADGRADIRNIHYLTHNKPWKPANFTYLDRYVAAERTCVYMYRDIWHKEASKHPLFSKYVPIEPQDDLHTLGILSRAFGEHYRQGR
ncbi:hypothetical protein NMP99_03115 [Glutamicibacter mishrai]|uniref:glycosyltransferase n=1 Tax=Glutamicibacter mishrai TaxID=1775880 RepID=UPI0020CFD030|nr:glycosyltransferase [Glutamicibacter mishrai]UTT40313.1 hypothetical protein NMP99_03115 [Glutamicibacter mishrai]